MGASDAARLERANNQPNRVCVLTQQRQHVYDWLERDNATIVCNEHHSSGPSHSYGTFFFFHFAWLRANCTAAIVDQSFVTFWQVMTIFPEKIHTLIDGRHIFRIWSVPTGKQFRLFSQRNNCAAILCVRASHLCPIFLCVCGRCVLRFVSCFSLSSVPSFHLALFIGNRRNAPMPSYNSIFFPYNCIANTMFP